jgi:hypothetical protein
VASAVKRSSDRRVAQGAAAPRFVRLLAAFALLAQLFALPYCRSQTPSDLAAVIAALKATFGDNVVICAQAEDPSAPAPQRDPRHGDESCPLCQVAARTPLLAPPSPVLPEPLALAEAPPPPRVDLAAPRRGPDLFAQPRAPPLAV